MTALHIAVKVATCNNSTQTVASLLSCYCWCTTSRVRSRNYGLV